MSLTWYPLIFIDIQMAVFHQIYYPMNMNQSFALLELDKVTAADARTMASRSFTLVARECQDLVCLYISTWLRKGRTENDLSVSLPHFRDESFARIYDASEAVVRSMGHGLRLPSAGRTNRTLISIKSPNVFNICLPAIPMEQRPEWLIDEVERKGATGLLAVQNWLVETTNGGKFRQNLEEEIRFWSIYHNKEWLA
jgi:hypothetical protein